MKVPKIFNNLVTITSLISAYTHFGHEMIVSMAEKLLNPVTRERVYSLLHLEFPTLKSAASWADAIKYKPEWAWSEKLHYVNVSDHAPEYCQLRFEAVGDNIVGAVANYTNRITSSDRNIQQEALLFLIHLIGDLHNPLHSNYFEFLLI